MQFAGQEHIELDPQELWDRLSDMNFISSLIPDSEGAADINSDGFTCRVRPRFMFFQGTMKLAFDVTESQPPERLAVRVTGKSIGAGATIDVEMQLAGAETGTDLQWAAVVAERKGLLKPIGGDLIRGAAERVIGDFWTSFRAALTRHD